ncbi:MAG: hypothetical protein JW866_09775, partial [Ignavibacteriales bacterium]|nr:hypothetical protein [Ignavibacteriales bacterium]
FLLIYLAAMVLLLLLELLSHLLFSFRLTISSVAGTASGKTDIKNKTFHHTKTRLKEPAVPVNCSFLLCFTLE